MKRLLVALVTAAFEVIFDHGTSPDGHFWYAHANPAGFGVH